MFEGIKKLIYFSTIQKIGRLPEDARVLVFNSEEQLPLYRHAFDSVRGAVFKAPLLDDRELAEVSEYVQDIILPDMYFPRIMPIDKTLVSYVYTEIDNSYPKKRTTAIADTIPSSLVQAGEKLMTIFTAATGHKPESVILSINNNRPFHFHEHTSDTLTYAAQGPATVCQGNTEYEMPKGSAVLMKRGHLYKAPDNYSCEKPRLTFVVHKI